MLAIIIHDVYSSVKLNEVMDIILAYPEVDIFIVSKATSSAAQTGVPEIEKKAFLKGKRVLYIPDLKDATELLNLDKLYLIVPEKLSKNRINFNDLKTEIRSKRIGIAISAGDTSFTSRELDLGEPVGLGLDSLLPPAAYTAIILYNLFST